MGLGTGGRRGASAKGAEHAGLAQPVAVRLRRVDGPPHRVEPVLAGGEDAAHAAGHHAGRGERIGGERQVERGVLVDQHRGTAGSRLYPT